MYICICVYTYIFMYVYTCIFTCIHSEYTCRCIYIDIYTYTHTRIHIYICIYMYIYVCAYIYAYTYTCVSIHSCILRVPLLFTSVVVYWVEYWRHDFIQMTEIASRHTSRLNFVIDSVNGRFGWVWWSDQRAHVHSISCFWRQLLRVMPVSTGLHVNMYCSHSSCQWRGKWGRGVKRECVCLLQYLIAARFAALIEVGFSMQVKQWIWTIGAYWDGRRKIRTVSNSHG